MHGDTNSNIDVPSKKIKAKYYSSKNGLEDVGTDELHICSTMLKPSKIFKNYLLCTTTGKVPQIPHKEILSDNL